MIMFSNAKINLGLFVLSKREDGFHEISSVKFPIPMSDVLEFLPAETFSLSTMGRTIDGNVEDNLIYKAYALLKVRFDLPGVRIVVQKNIPMGAGLGGGSSNATFALRGLNTFFDLKLSNQELKIMAAVLGSDCPFFVENTPQLASGKGEVLSPISLSLSGKFLYLIDAQIHVSTAQAYANVLPKESSFDWTKLHELNFSDWKLNLKNDFETSVFAVYPQLKTLKEQLYGQGARYAAMSGSGSAVFGIFETKPEKFSSDFGIHYIYDL